MSAPYIGRLGRFSAETVIGACDFNGGVTPQLALLRLATQGVSPKKTSSQHRVGLAQDASPSPTGGTGFGRPNRSRRRSSPPSDVCAKMHKVVMSALGDWG
jgi:hypothetical protein